MDEKPPHREGDALSRATANPAGVSGMLVYDIDSEPADNTGADGRRKPVIKEFDHRWNESYESDSASNRFQSPPECSRITLTS
jgi:hypothetical protein